MRIGIFDSGLGGLSLAQAIIARLPQYDYLYLGDTKRVPYGGRSQQTIHDFTSEALTYLFANDCRLVILACNTASAEALRKSQQEYLPRNYPERRVLGVIIPTAEVVAGRGDKTVGVIATRSTIASKAFPRELHRQDGNIQVIEKATPLLVPMIENDGIKYLDPILDDYLKGFENADALILGCTHYTLIKSQIREKLGIPIISQDEIVPEKTADYLARHPEIEGELGQHGERLYHVTDLGEGYTELAQMMAGSKINLELVQI